MGVGVGVGVEVGAVVPAGVLAGALPPDAGSVTTAPLVTTGGVLVCPPSSSEQERSTITSAMTITMSISRANITPAGLPFLRLLAMGNHLS